MLQLVEFRPICASGALKSAAACFCVPARVGFFPVVSLSFSARVPSARRSPKAPPGLCPVFVSCFFAAVADGRGRLNASFARAAACCAAYSFRRAACFCAFISASTFSLMAFAPALVGSCAASFACAAVIFFEGFFSPAAL